MPITIKLKKRPQLFRVGRQYANYSQRQRRNSNDRERIGRFLRCNMEETQLSIATASENISPTIRRKGRRRGGSLRERTVKRICSDLSAHNHHRFVLSIGQHGSTLLQETCMSEIAETYIHNNTDILNRKDGYLMIIFSFSFIEYILLHNYNKV